MTVHRNGDQLSILPTVIDDAWAAVVRLTAHGHNIDVGAVADYLGDLADHGWTPAQERRLRRQIAHLDQLAELAELERVIETALVQEVGR